jgi:hypothetical protein
MKEPLGISLFCDDIRFEQGNKMTLVGCYGPDMIINGPIPTVIPKLGILVQLRLPAGSSAASKILVYFPESKEGEPAVVMDIGAPNEETISASQNNLGSDLVPLLSTNVPLLLSPLLIRQAGLIKVRVECGANLIKAGTLRIISADVPSVTPPTV